MNKIEIKSKRLAGFTLIEVLIVVVIIGIIAGIAFPAYQNHVLSTNRKAAIADVLDLQQKLERQYNLNNGAYRLPFGEAIADTTVTGTCGTPGNYTSGTPTRYAFTVALANNNQSYTITATPCANQSTEECGLLQIDNTGLKKVRRQGSSTFTTDGSCF